MQSDSINTYIQDTKDQAEAAYKAAQDLSTQLATDLATVMGPASEAGSLDQAQLTEQIMALGPAPSARASAQERADYINDMAAALKATVERHTKQAIDKAGELTAELVKANIEKLTQETRMTVQQCDQALANTQGKSNTTEAEQTFKDSISTVNALMVQIEAQETRLKGVNMKLNTAYTALNADSPEGTDNIDKLHTLRRNIQEQMKTLQGDIINHYDSAFRQTKSKTNLLDLTIPKDVHTGKGQQVIDNMKAYLRGRAAEYYAIIPYLLRISDDFNAAEGTYWEPPSRRHGGYDLVSNALKKAYTDQSFALYHMIKEQLSTETFNKISSTYKYGIHEQKENRCEFGDGPSAYFALISLYKPIKATHRDTLTEEFNVAWTHFTKGDPKKKIKHLRPKLVEAIQLQLHLNWSMTGKKIVQVLSRSDHVMAQELKRFEKGPTNPEDTNVYLQDLFAAIEAEADKTKLVYGGDNKEWHASYASADERRPCKFGADCTDTLCTRSHPHGYKRSRTEFDSNRGKGKGGKGGKGATGKGGKGKGGKGKGGKGGKGRPACEAQGCSQITPHPSKSLCTTCFKKVIDTGSITKKDGTTFEFKGKHNSDQDKEQTKNAYGFSAEQIEGLRVMQQASVYRADGVAYDADEPPAPASIKRARIAERLGQRADDAPGKRTADFLAAINRQ